MAMTPWEVTQDFINNLQAEKRQRTQLDAEMQNKMYATDIARQNAATTFERQLARDQINHEFTQSQTDAAQKFRHDENYLTNVTYKKMGGAAGRRGHVSGGGTQPATSSNSGGVNPQSVMAYYRSKGVPDVVAAGIVGNIGVETGWDQNVFNGSRRGDNGTAAYAGQWRGPRQQALFQFAQSRGHSAPTVEDQLDFYVTEAQQMGVYDAAANARSPEEAAHIFMQHYEKPNPKYANADARYSGARAAIEGAGGVTASVNPQQRRYADASSGGVPTTDELLAAENAGVEPGDIAPQDLTPWTNEDFAQEGLNTWDIGSIPQGYDVVGTQFLSGVQLDQLNKVSPEASSLLLPIGGYSPTETNQYLILRPKQGTAKDAYGMPIDAPMTPPTPDTVAPTGQAPSAAGIQAPAPQISTIPTGRRTRRNAQGQVEFNVDGQWQTPGG